ncbi:TPM domain-containing protein [Paenibacillus motobuensis]|uniref:TPM domain-containing protein n=1 Tax=Paenibacillus TaxID=44249 RepID=UPI00203ADBB2|nr:TPM domain-containing protein [Paenibacillus lutimineralis]MCM3648654.1 TPM domain-containing protein [Paenibacillus motobuensis]
MKKRGALLGLAAIILLLVGYLFSPVPFATAAVETKKLIYDKANLLTEEEYLELNKLANELGAKRDTDIMLITTNNDQNLDVVAITQNFYDNQAPGYDKPHGNTVLLTLDMRNREVYIAGFYNAKQYLGDDRVDKIRGKISSDLSAGNYKQAFEEYIQSSYEYMGIKPGVNPDNILFNIWFQLGGALAIGAIVVGIMAARTGGRVTVSRRTYEDGSTSGIVGKEDRYIRTTVTKQKIEKSSGSSSSSGGGGGGGITGGGHSHSGSRGSF